MHPLKHGEIRTIKDATSEEVSKSFLECFTSAQEAEPFQFAFIYEKLNKASLLAQINTPAMQEKCPKQPGGSFEKNDLREKDGFVQEIRVYVAKGKLFARLGDFMSAIINYRAALRLLVSNPNEFLAETQADLRDGKERVTEKIKVFEML